jgi:predicted O-methyltransferase YrrM
MNIIRNALRPGYASVMINKVALRWRERGHARERGKIRDWCVVHAKPVEEWAMELDSKLWIESCEFTKSQEIYARAKLAGLDFELGGGGASHLLYFLTRLLKPEVIIETGVAAGFSSRAFLCALSANGSGRLLSSDFPYFRAARPERFVGYLVEERMRDNWTLLLKGDRTNLTKLTSSAGKIDLFHYDSDKSYAGREFAYEQIAPCLGGNAVVVFDDIEDNWHFRDFVRGKSFRVIEYEGRWVGLTGGPEKFYAD